MKKRISLVVVLTLVMAVLLSGCGDPEKKVAKEAFANEVTRIQGQLMDRDTVTEAAQAVIDANEKPLYESDREKLIKTVKDANKLEFTEPDVPKETEEIKAGIEDLKKIDFTDSIEAVKNAQKKLEDSIKKYKLLVHPEEKFIIDRLKKVDGIISIKGVTEDNDPNGQLNKEGGYTAQIYYSYDKAKEKYSLYTGDVIEDGTDGGGSIEVYTNEENAQKRNDYLGAFDGGVLSSGKHAVFGTCVVRESAELTATEQKKLEQAVVEALTKLPKE